MDTCHSLCNVWLLRYLIIETVFITVLPTQLCNFSGGVIVGAVIQRNGFLSELGIILPGGQNYYYDDYGTYIGTNYIDDR